MKALTILKRVLIGIALFFCFFGMSVFYSFKELFTGFRTGAKVAIVLFYATLGLTVFLAPVIFFILLGLVAVFTAIITVRVLVTYYCESPEPGGKSAQEAWKERFSGPQSTGAFFGSFFSGMRSEEENRKEFRRLMKEYHPDNGNKDPEMARRISDEYRRYKATVGNR